MPEGTVNGEPYSVPEGYSIVREGSLDAGRAALDLLRDLDRNASGRHEGDIDSFVPEGHSQGNPLLPAGTHIGYSLDGALRIVVPSREKLGDPSAWYQRAASSGEGMPYPWRDEHCGYNPSNCPYGDMCADCQPIVATGEKAEREENR